MSGERAVEQAVEGEVEQAVERTLEVYDLVQNKKKCDFLLKYYSTFEIINFGEYFRPRPLGF